MLFNSHEFIFIFLPVVLLGFYLIGRTDNHRIAILWLVTSSLFFYGWWNFSYLIVILISILFNYSIGFYLSSFVSYKLSKRSILIFGITVNIIALGYFKYANFFIDNLNIFIDTNITFNKVILPLAVSFFTFQQIAYLVDAYKEKTKENSFLYYCLFVTFFPQLIAGPIVHHKEMLPQFSKNIIHKLQLKNLAIGFTIFTFGLFKKIVLADGIAVHVNPIFTAAEAGVILTFFEAWSGALAYTFQLYFDFSGYSDMAIGIARMFGIRLPLNFNSPYKAISIIDFWKRWHITLSRFLRDYLYIPLGGNRKGRIRRYINLIITMVLGGLWHGAGWTFILWGALHGFYLVVNNFWRSIFKNKIKTRLSIFFSWSITFLAVVVSWVPFRAESIYGAGNILSGMLGLHGISLKKSLAVYMFDYEKWLSEYGIIFEGFFSNEIYLNQAVVFKWILALFVISVALPNVQQIMINYKPAFEAYKNKASRTKYKKVEWRPTLLWACVTTLFFVLSILLLTRISEFLYFQF